MKNYFDLTGQVAIVTGCSTGLGVQMAKALANQGCNIVCVARRQNLIDEVAASIEKEYGVTSCGIACEITDTDQVNNLIDQVLQRFGRIDILVNNVGIGTVVAAEDMKNLLRAQRDERIMIFSTHIMELALTLCDEIVLLKDGRFEKLEMHDSDGNKLSDEEIRDTIISALKDGEA